MPAHTQYERETLGSKAFLAPEHEVVLTEDDDEAREIGRSAVQNPYLGLRKLLPADADRILFLPSLR